MNFVNSLKKLTVKVVSKHIIGSGIIFCPSDTSEFCFIITARHCIHGLNFDNGAKQEDIKIEELYAESLEAGTYQMSNDDKIIWSEKKGHDIAILKIPCKELISKIGNIPKLRLLTFAESKSDCFFRGFPYWDKNEFPRTVDARLEIRDSEKPRFHIKVTDDFSQYMVETPANLVKGLSGSGVCVDINDSIYLFGIVTDYEAASHRFICQNVNELILKECKDVQFYNIEVERTIPEQWFIEQLERSSKNMGPRFTWKNNYPVDIEKEFSTFGRDDTFRNLLQDAFFKCVEQYKVFQNEINSKHQGFLSLHLKKLLSKQKFKIEKKISLKKAFYIYDESFSELLLSYQKLNYGNKNLPLKTLNKLVNRTMKLSEVLVDYFSDYGDLSNKVNKNNANEANEVRSLILSLKSELEKLGEFIIKHNDLANSSLLIISGKAGNGKSQLLAYAANQRAKNGNPSILVLGQRLLRSVDPWGQILKELGLSCASEMFLIALNKKGESLNKIVIIFIDALNEGQGIRLWNQNILSFIETVGRYKWIKLVVSYRTSYKEALFRNITLPPHYSLIHSGFLGVEEEARRFFFEIYNIQESDATPFSTEFQNPLFLKLFCLALTGGGFKGDINSYSGIVWVIEHFLKYVNEILGLPENFNYRSENLNLVKKVVDGYVKRSIEENKAFLNYEEVFTETEGLVSIFLNKRGFLNGLIDEEVFYENLIRNNERDEIVIDFSYEKFGDHLKVNYLLKDIDKNDLKSSISQGGKLHYYFADTESFQKNKGLMEALMIQVPFRYGLNLIDIIRDEEVFRNYIPSLIYEIVGSLKDFISPITIGYIKNQILNNAGAREVILDQILTIYSNSKLYFNAEFLHKTLMPLSMADRDSIWTSFLQDRFYSLEETTSVSSVIQRIVNIEPHDISVDKDVIWLNCVVSCWFLSSSNRRLRDYSTKALIHLLSQRLEILIRVLNEFGNCNDPYVVQRIYAIALGCVIRTKQLDRLNQVCRIIFEKIFNQSIVPPDILLRDYARECIEYAISIGLKFDFEIEKIRPPYKSPTFDSFPTNNDISKYLKENDKNEGRYGLEQIMKSMVTEFGKGTSSYGDFGRYVFGSAVKNWKKVNENDLSNLAIKKIIEEYGYDVNKHGVFDSKDRFGSRARNYYQMERIGKKYQWISLFEILATLSDNYQFYDERFKDNLAKFEGPWLPFVRDIDPTTLFIKSNELEESKSHPNKLPFFNWSGSPKKWIKASKMIPMPSQMIKFNNSDDDDWLALEFYSSFKEPDIEDDSQAKEIWFQIRSYICKESDYVKITNWAKRQNFMGRWMPESTSRYEVFNREFYWAPSSQTFKSEYYSGNDWQTIHAQASGKNIGDVAVTAIQYNWERENDMSPEHGISFYKPSRFLFELLNLKYSETDGELVNQHNKLVCFDSSLTIGGGQRLVINKKELLSTLKKNGLRIFWTVLGEKLITGNYQNTLENIPGRLEISGLVTESNGKLSDNLKFY